MADLPEYYFRIRDNGAAVYRVVSDDRRQRLDLDEIAAVNVKNGNVKPHGQHELTDADQAAIETWLADRREVLAGREAGQAAACIEALNLTAQWAQSRADDAALEAVTEELLLAMHDLRAVLVRKKAGRVAGD